MTVLGNIHATVVAVAHRGILITGPSGCGKSTLAMALIAEALYRGDSAALVADDQVFITIRDGNIIASRPESIAGLVELRGAGIGMVDSVPEAIVHCSIQPFHEDPLDRLPPDREMFELGSGFTLPHYRIDLRWKAPLMALEALIRARTEGRS